MVTETEAIQLTNSPYGLIEVADFKVYGNNIYYIWYDILDNQPQIFTGISNLDGSGFIPDQRTYPDTTYYTNPSIQIANNKIYYLFGSYFSNILTAWFMEETGWNEVVFVTSTPTYSADFKVTGDKILYIWSGEGTLWTGISNLDGSNFVETFRGNYIPIFTFYRLGPQIDASETKAYYIWTDGNLWTAISDLDGSNFVITQRTLDRNILDPQIQIANNKVYYTWSDYIDNQIYTATSNLDGTGWNILTQTSSITTTGKENVQFQVLNDRIYYIWSNRNNLDILDLYTAQFDPVTGMTETLKVANNNDNIFPKLQAEILDGNVKLYYVWLADIGRTNNWQIFFTTDIVEIPTAPTVGNISFSSTPPGAKIIIDGNDTGQATPMTITDIIQGPHSYILRLANYYDYTGTIDVIVNQTITVSATLQPMVGNVYITSSPTGAKIFVDNMDTGQVTPTTITNLISGIHGYTLYLEGYYDYIGSVDIIENTTVTVETILIPKIGNISFTSTPSGARIIIDGTDTGQITPATISLTSGMHIYTLSLQGYYAYTGNVNVIENTSVTIDTILIPITGNVSLTSTPSGARIAIDGTDTGQITPATISLTPGMHIYTISLTGYYDYTANIYVIEDITIGATVILTPRPGNISFTSIPDGAKIYIDEAFTGLITPAIVTNVPAGTHAYRLSKWAYYDHIGTVDVIADTTVGISITLYPMETGCQAFSSVPIGSRIFIDDIDFGIFTPIKMCGIPIGTHTYRLEGSFTIAEKGKPCQIFVSVPKGSVLHIDGVYMGLTPEIICDITLGTHAYNLEGIFTVEKVEK